MDFLAIGDTVVDTFIRLKDAEVHCDINNEHCTISMRWGDKIPFEFAKTVPAVGNSANAAVAAARLGLKSALVAGVGRDREGEDCLAQFTKEGVSTEYVTIKDGEETVTNYVLWYLNERTILVKYARFEYPLPSPMPSPKVVYLSSIGEANFSLHEPIADWLEQDPKTMLTFQPNTFHIKAGVEKLRRIYARANYFFANKDEYQRILVTQEEDVVKLMKQMQGLGPRICFLTDGVDGSYALDGNDAWQMPVYPEGKNAYERTGAGDAFSSAATVALTIGKSVAEALKWGSANGAFVVQKVGAQEGLLTRDELEAFVAKTPSDCEPKPL